MNCKKIIACFMSAGVLFTMAGCSGESGVSKATQTTKLNYNIEAETNLKNLEVIDLDYNLGKDTIDESSGKKLSYDIKGSLSVPKDGENYPLVVVAHGSHGGDFNSRFDKGFEYLLHTLAKQGYAAISLNVQPQFTLSNGEPEYIERLDSIYKKQMDMLSKANAGEDVGFATNLKGKIDLDKKVFIGHSSSGQNMMILADRLAQNEDNSVKGVISIAPSQTFHISKVEEDGVPASKEFYPNIPTGIIVPEYDGDVSSLDGFSIYEKIVTKDDDRTAPISVTLLKGGKHNFFNTMLDEDTMFLDQDIVIKDKLPKESHQDFLVNYSLDFLRYVLNGDAKGTVFDVTSPSPNKMYGFNVVTKLDTSASSEVNVIKDSTISSKTDSLLVEDTIEHWIPVNDKVGAFRDPRLCDEIPLSSISWTEKSSFLNYKLDATRDFSCFENVSLALAQDPTNELNSAKSGKGLVIELKDSKGSTSRVEIDNTNNSLAYVDGVVVDNSAGDEEHYYYSNYTPISEIRIPLSYFEGIDLTKITDVAMYFNENDKGNILVESIYVR